MSDVEAPTIEQRIEAKIDKQISGGLPVVAIGGTQKLAVQNMGEAMEMAKLMAVSGPAVPIGLRNNPGACFAVVLQALNWGMQPFAVARKCYIVKNKHGEETLAFEAQLFHAVVNERAPLKKRLEISYEGVKEAKTCTIKGWLEGEEGPKIYTTPPIANIAVKNSPLWSADVDQQLAYYAVRAWARKHVPEVILGVYTPDEIAAEGQFRGPENAKDITPQRPRPEDYKDEPVDFEIISQFGEVMGTLGPRGFTDSMIETLHRFQTIKIEKTAFDTFIENNKANIARLRTMNKNAFAEAIEDGIRVATNNLWAPEPEPVDQPSSQEKQPESKASTEAPTEPPTEAPESSQGEQKASEPPTPPPTPAAPTSDQSGASELALDGGAAKDKILWKGTDGQTQAFQSIIDLKAHIKKGVAKKGVTAAQLQAMLDDNERQLKLLRGEGGPAAAIVGDITELLENAIKVRTVK